MVRSSECGRKICIEEGNGERFGKLELELGASAWVIDCLVAAAELSNPLGFWWRRWLERTNIFFQVLANSRRRFALLFVESFNG